MITIERKVHFGRGRRSEKKLRDAAPPPPPVVADRVPRISRLMALAIRFDQLIRDGSVAGQAELARLGRVTRARLTQIMNLLHLAPDIQEAILFLPPTGRGRDRIAEIQLRPIAAIPDWHGQRRLWQNIMSLPQN